MEEAGECRARTVVKEWGCSLPHSSPSSRVNINAYEVQVPSSKSILLYHKKKRKILLERVFGFGPFCNFILQTSRKFANEFLDGGQTFTGGSLLSNTPAMPSWLSNVFTHYKICG